MNRWVWFCICGALGAALLACGWLVPAHLRAVDSAVLEKIGSGSQGLTGRTSVLLSENRLGAAQMLSAAAILEDVPGAKSLASAVTNFAVLHPDLNYWGGRKPTIAFLPVTDSRRALTNGTEPFADFIIRTENRQKALDQMIASHNPATRELLDLRALTNTVLLPPVGSSSGQALDASICLAGLLVEERALTSGMSNSLFTLAASANRGGSSLECEQSLMNLLSLAQRFNWGQITEFLSATSDPETLRLQTHLARTFNDRLPVLFSAVELSSNPGAVARYVMNFGVDGLDDLGKSLRFGPGGVNELLQRNQRLHLSTQRPRLLVDWCLRSPGFGLTVKWSLFLLAGFFLAMAAHFARRVPSGLEKPLRVRGFHVAREILFALGFLLVVLLMSEPFLAYHSQAMQLPIRFRLPTQTEATLVVPGKETRFMNEVLLTMLLFFVLQALLYVACLVKLAEIKRQQVPARMKLLLLDNEDHLFDAGLYLGFVGTIISFVLVSMGVFKQPSLMAAYSSTSFGIIFVSLFKILHLRAARRKLLLQAEATQGEPVDPQGVTVQL